MQNGKTPGKQAVTANKTRMALLGAGEEEIKNGACSTLSGQSNDP